MQVPQQFISSGAQGGEHGPQSTEPPHPSAMTPHRARAFRQVRGTQRGPASTGSRPASTVPAPAFTGAGDGSERADTQERPRRHGTNNHSSRERPASRDAIMTGEVNTRPPPWVRDSSRTQEAEAAAAALASRMALSCLDSWESWLAV